LNLLNDPVFVEAAQALAARIWTESPADDTQRLDHAFLLTLARFPTAEEAERLLSYVEQQRTRFTSEDAAVDELLQNGVFDGDSNERAAWVALASVLLNLDEFITRE
jgi:hypothetical protein